jgi:acetyltransferase-like isoleucine patch superfamily enzyme
VSHIHAVIEGPIDPTHVAAVMRYSESLRPAEMMTNTGGRSPSLPADARASDLTGSSPTSSLLGALKKHGLLGSVGLFLQVVSARLQLRRCNSLGRWVRIRGRVRVRNEGSIDIADKVRFLAETAASELVVWPGGRLEIGEGTSINYGTSISASGQVTIGRNCLIGTYVNVMDCTFHNVSDKSWNIDSADVTIGDNVWLGNRCMIMKGVTIGSGAVVAACSLVTRDVPPNSMVVGVPARVVKQL